MLPAPRPSQSRFDPDRVRSRLTRFVGKATCASCYVPPLRSEPDHNPCTTHEIRIDAFRSKPSPTRGDWTGPMKVLWIHGRGCQDQDGRFSTLQIVTESPYSLRPVGEGAETSITTSVLRVSSGETPCRSDATLSSWKT